MSERGRTLRELREVAGLTERQLARKLVLTAARVMAWERGTLRPSRLQEGRLAGAFGVWRLSQARGDSSIGSRCVQHRRAGGL